MMDGDKIEVGDMVSVHWATEEAFYDATVLYTPQATGDSWRLRLADGDLAYVQQFETMILEKKVATK